MSPSGFILDQTVNELLCLCVSVKLWGKVSESLGKICCVRPHIERFTFVGESKHSERKNQPPRAR